MRFPRLVGAGALAAVLSLAFLSRTAVSGEVQVADVAMAVAVGVLLPLRWRLLLDARVAWAWLAAYTAFVLWSGAAASSAAVEVAKPLAGLLYAAGAALAFRELERWAGRVTAVVIVVLGAWAIVALGLFYTGTSTSALGTYGDLPASDAYARLQLGMPHPNLLASWCLMAAGLLWLGAVRRSVRLAASVVLCLVAVATLSRGVLALAVVFVWLALPAWRSVRLAVVAAGAVLVVLLAFVAVDGDEGVRLTSDTVRAEAMSTSAETLRSEPVFGVGPGRPAGRSDGTAYRAHFTPLDIAATTGVPSLLALVGLGIWLMRRRYAPAHWPLVCAGIGVLIDALGQDVQHFRHVWALVGLLIAAGVDHPNGGGSPG